MRQSSRLALTSEFAGLCRALEDMAENGRFAPENLAAPPDPSLVFDQRRAEAGGFSYPPSQSPGFWLPNSWVLKMCARPLARRQTWTGQGVIYGRAGQSFTNCDNDQLAIDTAI